MHTRAIRFDLLTAATNGVPLHTYPYLLPPAADHRPFDLNESFGENIFTLAEMRARLSEPVFAALLATIERGAELDSTLLDAVAAGMREWATERGATHFTHWFQPLTGLTAEKHDAFLTPNAGGGAVASFCGKDLVQGEPDASSLPTGGLRATFEARGYTTWDPTSPAFIVEAGAGAYLAIPTAFTSWTGDALDTKIPLLRSIEALAAQVRRALRLFGVEPGTVQVTLGPEQEYFLVDQEFFYRRPDLVTTGRTLFGAKPPRGQELKDHYFGTIPEEVLAFMMEVERELYRLGVPVRTRHNEVAPGQYELVPLYENANLAADHQQLIMLAIRKLAPRYGLVALLHEKPFTGVNGSGKHLNWSISNGAGNLFEPGESPHENLQFLFFCTAVLRAVERHQALLRASVASAGNDCRLGGNEAPPSIVSVFLGEPLYGIFAQLAAARTASAGRGAGLLGLGTPVLPPVPIHAGDRNRTSPIAFTGNKFEFRAPGAAQSISFPATVLNTIVAEAIGELATALEAELHAADNLEAALHTLLSRELPRSTRILFNGDGYSAAWHREAERRGLVCPRHSLDVFPALTAPSTIAAFERQNVLSRRELESREEILYEQYFRTINIEGEMSAEIARTMVLPAAIRYLNDLLAAAERAATLGVQATGVRGTIVEINALIDELTVVLRALVAQNAELGGDDVRSKAHHMRDRILPAMAAVREVVDRLEKVLPDDLWPLPRYREMLFVK
jgi:glutamine synthetase